MQSIGTPTPVPATLQADEYFTQHCRSIHKETDRLMAGLIAAQWILEIALAFVLSPRSWAGQTSSVHPHVYAAILLGALFTIPPLLLAVRFCGNTFTRHCIAVCQMSHSGLLIHLTGGRLETHFHVFGSLAFLAFYRDWKVLITATAVTGLDHLFRGLFWPQSVYGITLATWYRTLEHASWVIFEDIFLILSCLRSCAEMRTISKNRAYLKAATLLSKQKSLNVRRPSSKQPKSFTSQRNSLKAPTALRAISWRT